MLAILGVSEVARAVYRYMSAVRLIVRIIIFRHLAKYEAMSISSTHSLPCFARG